MSAAVFTQSKALQGSFARLNSTHTVLLLGWAGSDDRMLSKYSSMYESRGLDTLRFTASLKSWSPRGLAGMRDISPLQPQLEKLLGREKRFVVHVMSMNGVYSLCSLLAHSRTANLLRRTDAVVWDSCPITLHTTPITLLQYGFVYDHSHREEWTASEEGTAMDRLRYRMKKATAMKDSIRNAIEIWSAVNIQGKAASEVHPYYHMRERSDLPSRHLFVYSDTDEVCKPETIHAFHTYVSEKRGVNTDILRFADSPHVQHFRKHGKEYEAAVDKLLNEILNEIEPKAKM